MRARTTISLHSMTAFAAAFTLSCSPTGLASRLDAALAHPSDPTLGLNLTIDPAIEGLPEVSVQAVRDPVHGGTLRWLEAGADKEGVPPVLLVHGLGTAGMRDFYALLPVLANRGRVYALDLPGFARSSKANKYYGPETYAQVLAHLIRTRAGGKVDLVGHSLGGATVIEMAGSHPDLVNRLVVIDAAVILHREALVTSHVFPKPKVKDSRVKRASEMTYGFGSTVLQKLRSIEPDPAVVVKSHTLRRTMLSGDAGRISALSFMLHNFSPALAGIESPTLILWGRNDTTAPLRSAYMIHNRIPQSSLVVLDGVAHVPQNEATARVLEDMVEFLNATSASPAPNAPTERLGNRICKNQHDQVFRGAYDTIVLDGCDRALLDHVTARSVQMTSSSVDMLNPRIGTDGSGEPAITAVDSTFTITGGTVVGAPSMTLREVNADIAGAVLTDGKQSRLRAEKSRVLYSVTLWHSEAGPIHLHGER